MHYSSTYDITNEKIEEKDDINKFKAYDKNNKYIEKDKINILLDLRRDKYYYHFIFQRKINEEFIYRCKYTNACKVKIFIDIINMKSLIKKEKDNNVLMEFKYNKNNKNICEKETELTLKKIYKKK